MFCAIEADSLAVDLTRRWKFLLKCVMDKLFVNYFCFWFCDNWCFYLTLFQYSIIPIYSMLFYLQLSIHQVHIILIVSEICEFTNNIQFIEYKLRPFHIYREYSSNSILSIMVNCARFRPMRLIEWAVSIQFMIYLPGKRCSVNRKRVWFCLFINTQQSCAKSYKTFGLTGSILFL